MTSNVVARTLANSVVVTALALLLNSCGGGSAGSNGVTPDSGQTSSGIVGNDDPTGGGLSSVQGGSARVSWRSVLDTTSIGGGLEALKLLAPNGWTIGGGMFWNPVLSNGGVSRDYSVISPDSTSGFEYIRKLPYFWSDSIATLVPIGEVYQFQGRELRPAMGASDYLLQIAMPQLPYSVTTFGATESMPEVAEAVRAITPSPGFSGSLQADAARVRIAFTANGINFEGELHAWLVYANTVDAFGAPLTLWEPDRVFLVYAPAGELDESVNFLLPLVLSEVVNPIWAQLPPLVEQRRVATNDQVLASNQALASFLQANSAATFDLIDQTFRNASAANDRVFDSYDQYMRGVDTWQDPSVGPVELPSGFGQVWANPASGEYLLLNDPSFDPNVTLPGNWTPLNRR